MNKSKLKAAVTTLPTMTMMQKIVCHRPKSSWICFYEGVRGNRQPWHSRPVVLVEDEGDTPDHTANFETTSTSVNAGPVPASELSRRADPSKREPWWDVEEGCFVKEDLHPFPPLDHKGLASTPAQDQPPSRRQSLEVSQDHTKPHGDNTTTRSASEEPAIHSLIITSDQEGGGESEENVSDLERGTQLAFEGQGKSLATSSSSPGRRSFETSQPPIDQDCDRGWSEELRFGTRLCIQEKYKEGPRKQEKGDGSRLDKAQGTGAGTGGDRRQR
ncbi:MAG: Chitin synthase, class 2 [Chaenotheca gracillima]|nr:MAG: Chitin synthase, class 2 [Chaenotheca gracillima]